MSRRRDRFRRALIESISSPAWGAELAGAVGLIHYARLLGSPVRAGNFAELISRLLSNSIWDDVAFWVGLASLVLSQLALWGRVEWCRLRQFVAALSGVLWGILIYACWKGDSPFVLWEIFIAWLACPLVAFVLLHVQSARKSEESRSG
jgi:hypothetical protein